MEKYKVMDALDARRKTVFEPVKAPGIRRQFPDVETLVRNTDIRTADNAQSVMNFAKTLGYRRKRR